MTRRALSLALVLATAACKKPPPETKPQEPPPVDHLAPNEVPAGHEHAFALELPRDSKVMARFGNVVEVKSSLEPELVSNFVRARVKAGKAIVGSTMTTFDHVVVPEEPTRELTIDVRRGAIPGGRTLMTIRDSTPGAPAEIPTTEAWRRAGMTPDGKQIDPKKVE